MIPVIYQTVYAIIFLWSIWCIMSSKVNDGVLGRVFYSAIALAAFAAFFAKQPITIERSNQILIAAVACIGIRHFIMKLYSAHRNPRT